MKKRSNLSGLKPAYRVAIQKIARLVRRSNDFLLTTHEMPDGDGLGAQSALYVALKKMGKRVKVVNHDALPEKFDYLAFKSAYQKSDTVPPHQVCFVMDAGSFSRIREGVSRGEFSTLVNVDHHYSNNLYGDYNLVIPEASATGEVIYHLIKALGVKVDAAIAESVYTSLVTDTGVPLPQHHAPRPAVGRRTGGSGRRGAKGLRPYFRGGHPTGHGPHPYFFGAHSTF